MDTNVLVAAWRSRAGVAFAIVEEWLAGALDVAATPALFLEYEEVLKRPEHLLGRKAAAVDALLDALAGVCIPVQTRITWRPRLRDADDDFVLDAALNGGAHAIVTFNRADFLPQAEELGLEVLAPVDYLRRVI